MKVLVIAPFLPYPQAKSGAPRAVFDRVRLLSRHNEVSVAAFAGRDEQQYKADLRRMGVQVYSVASPSERAAGTWQSLWRKRVRLALGLVPDSRPMLVQEFGSRRMCKFIAALIRRHRFDVVLVEHILMAQYITCVGHPGKQSRGVPVVFTEHDIRTAFPGAPLSLEAARWRLPLLMLDRLKWRRYAGSAYKQAAAVTLPTPEDALILRANVPGVEPFVVPFGLAPFGERDRSNPQTPEAESRKEDTLLFVGNFDHPPNRDAVQWLCDRIMPLVWRLRPSVKLWVVGRNPTPEVRALQSGRIKVWGEVPSVADYLRRCTLFVAPLRQGGGMRIKLIEALSAGAPVVTTELGAQGLGTENGRHLLVAKGAVAFAACILEALEDAALRERLGREGQRLVSAQAQEQTRLENLESLLAEVAVRAEGRDGHGSGRATKRREVEL